MLRYTSGDCGDPVGDRRCIGHKHRLHAGDRGAGFYTGTANLFAKTSTIKRNETSDTDLQVLPLTPFGRAASARDYL